MPLDSSIPFQSMAPDPMVSLNSMLDMGTKSLSLQKNRATFDADVARSKAESSSAESKASVDSQSINGNVARTNADASTAQSTAAVGQATIGSRVQQSTAAGNTAQTGADSAAVDLNTKRTQNAAQALQALMNSPALNAKGNQYDPAKAAAAIKTISAYAIETGQDPSRVNPTADRMLDASDKEGGSLQVLRGIVQSMLTPHESATIGNPNIQTTDSGNTIYSRDNNPNSQTFSGNPTATVTKQLPPTQENIGPNNEKSVIGAVPPSQGGMGAQPPANSAPPSGLPPTLRDEAISRAKSDLAKIEQEASNPKPRTAEQMRGLNDAYARTQNALTQANAMPIEPVANPRFPNAIATGMKPGQEANLKDNTEAMNTHFAKISGAASDAPLALSLVSNIKSLANGAITGTLQGRTSYVNGLLNSVHLGDKISGDLQKDTDLLEKYLSQLNLSTPAATNAARDIITAARPHGTMIKGALTEAADQIGSVVNSNMAVRNHLAGYKFANGGTGDAVGYDTEKRHIEGIADPRIFQMQGKSKDEIKAYMAKLPIADQQDLVRKSGLLHQMGITK